MFQYPVEGRRGGDFNAFIVDVYLPYLVIAHALLVLDQQHVLVLAQFPLYLLLRRKTNNSDKRSAEFR